ncbi:ABC transporter ATP-binding protein [Ancylobacter lacus]|uniref:ABC transporter ATP-binding protein n=1 Tax=Ancylobacter lacus TaxID=2579970 RepID=UPI001BD10019|nr:ABC transporter ATP-binding protein [Ancylobacter lacus]MBS7538612.1 ABC transporter ATP-binding protein [Ancylobacter lacus]
MSLHLDRISLTVGGVPHLDSISLTLERGTINVLLGPTLAGKTSLMRVMAGLDRPTSGRLLADGADITGRKVEARNVAMVYQQFINYPALTVYENIASPLRVQRRPAAEIDRKVRAAAELLRLENHLGRTPLQLSGGQQQRCAIARAVVKGSDLVLLDEPLANLDYKLREELREELPRIFAASGAIFVYATTEPTEALLLGGNTATLSEGRLVQFGPTAALYHRPASLRAAETFSDPPLNVMAVEKRGEAILLPGGATARAAGLLAGLADGGYRVGVRAHELLLARPSRAGAIAIRGTVDVTEMTGSESFVHVHAGPLRWVALTPGMHEVAPGAPIDVFVDPDRIFVFAPDGGLAAGPADSGA